ncbi:recombinase family protein [Streptococcus suis]|nr:recombinase family protein [Streptococcus suis]
MIIQRKVAIYVRVSTTSQAEEGYSIEEQISSLRKYCEAMNWNVFHEYVDAGFSGGKLERPEMSNLINDAKKQLFDTVLVYKLDRLSRSVKDTLHLMQDIFTPSKVDFVSLQENIDTSSAMGTLFITLLSAISEFEREQITERMKMGKTGRAKAGKAMSWRWTAFGYDYNRETGILELDPVKAPLVKMVFDEYLKGTSIDRIVDKMNSLDYTGKDKPWAHHGVASLLDNPVYYGMNRYNNKIFQGKHEPVIDKKTFDLVQKERQRRRLGTPESHNAAPWQTKYIATKVCRCGLCGERMKIDIGKPRKRDGFVPMVYYCKNSRPLRSATCQNVLYQKDIVEDYILKEVAKLQQNPSILRKGRQRTDEYELERKRNRLLETIQKNNNQLSKLNDLYLNDLISLEELKKRSEILIKRKKYSEERLELSYETTEIDKREHKITSFLAFPDILTADYETQLQAVELVIEKVELTKDDYKIYLSF